MATLLVAPPLLCAVVDGYRAAVLARAQADAILLLVSQGGGREVPAVRDDLEILRPWRLRALACALLLAASLLTPRPARITPAPAPGMRQIDSASAGAAKTCDPACKSPEVCVDGTCCLPAQTSPAAATPRPHDPQGLTLTASPWLPDSLR